MNLLTFFFLFICLGIRIFGTQIQDKVLICGICKNIEKTATQTIQSIEMLGSQFKDYRVIIYENNSIDQTKEIISNWAKDNNHVIFISETASHRQLSAASNMKLKKPRRTENIARARNIVLDIAMKETYSDYKYVIWADLDFQNSWDVENVVDTILRPQEEWDAVFANGAYDLYALRDEEFPIGEELLGPLYWKHISKIRSAFVLHKTDPWRKVYSAFGGLGIYKRDSLSGCRYSGTVTKDLEQVTFSWLENAKKRDRVCLLKEYLEQLKQVLVVDVKTDYLKNRKKHPKVIGMRLHNKFGNGKVVWFSGGKECPLPETCEHIPLHASMIVRGKDKLFINPKIISNQ